jgi:hypothetical protein
MKLQRLKEILDYRVQVPVALLLGLAPFYPQPHIVEKLRMLAAGTLQRPIDIFDLFWHAWPFALLAVRALLGRLPQEPGSPNR